MTTSRRYVTNFLTLLLLLAVSGCATQGTHAGAPAAEGDPLESINRDIYVFNEKLDDYVLAPAARGWVAITTQTMRTSASNFFDNLAYPGVLINDLLQGKIGHAGGDTARFLVNSSLGMGGLLDPASHMGLESRSEDFGQTLGSYDVGTGPYLVLPLLGPSSARDVTRYPVGYYTNVLTYLALNTATAGAFTVVNVVNSRAQLESAVRLRNEAALDPYAFTRSTYLQYRRNQVHDGQLPKEKEDLYEEYFNE